MRCEEAQELITALADNEVSAEERRAVESHLRECGNCQSAHAIELDLKRQTRAAAEALNAPADLRRNLALLVDYSSKQTPTQQPMGRWWSTTAWTVALAATVLVVVVLPYLYFGKTPQYTIAPKVFDIHRHAVAGDLTTVAAKDGPELARQLASAVDDEFKPMGYDLSTLGLAPVSGSVQEIGDKKVLVVVYRGDGPEITCFTFDGVEHNAPLDAKLFFDPEKKMNFYMFEQNGISAVLHQEHGLICILVSQRPMQELLNIAREKARRHA